MSAEDEGPGITEAERERVLERFFRIAGMPGSGCGLGLAIGQEIARAHGATLEITQPKARKFNCTHAVSLGLAAAVHRRFHAESHRKTVGIMPPLARTNAADNTAIKAELRADLAFRDSLAAREAVKAALAAREIVMAALAALKAGEQ